MKNIKFFVIIGLITFIIIIVLVFVAIYTKTFSDSAKYKQKQKIIKMINEGEKEIHNEFDTKIKKIIEESENTDDSF